MLKSDGDMPLSYDRFLSMCRSDLSNSKYEMLRDLTLASSEGPLISEWAKFYGVLKEELTYQRNVRLGRKASMTALRDEGTAKIVSAALADKNPLAAEEMLLKLQFKKLDELIGVHYFDDYALMGYALKLKLLERKKSFDLQKGKAEFNRIIENLECRIMSMEQE